MRAADVSAARMTGLEGSRRDRRSRLTGKWVQYLQLVLGVVTGFAPVRDAFLGFTAAFLGAAVFLGLMFSDVTSFAVAVTWGTLVAIVSGWALVLGMGLGALALTAHPPRTTWLHASTRSIYSAEGPVRLDFGAAVWLVSAVR